MAKEFSYGELGGSDIYGYGSKKKSLKKRKTLTPGQRIFFWEHPKLCSKRCNICHERIKKMSELELDHTKAHSKGGTKLAFAHKLCNRIKGSGSLGKAQEMMGIKSKTKRKSTKRVKKKLKKLQGTDLFDIPKIEMPKFDFGA